ITIFAVYQDWDKRPPGFSQEKIIGELQHELRAVRAATIGVLPPSPIPGLGNAFGFQMMVEDRGSNGLQQLQKSVDQILARAHGDPGFLRMGFTTFSAHSPQVYLDIDRVMAKSLGVTVNDVFKSLQAYLGSSYINQFNQFNQSFQVRVQAASEYRSKEHDI